MEVLQKCCLCLKGTNFSVPLFGSYCREHNLIDKIYICLKIVFEESDIPQVICYKCVNKVDLYHEFHASVKNHQPKEGNGISFKGSPTNHVRRHVTSYVREQVFDADYTFSFLEVPNEEKKEPTSSSTFSYFSPPNLKQSKNVPLWKKPRPVCDEKKVEKQEKYKKPCKSSGRSRHNSRDLFESQSQEVDEGESRSLDWKLTPDDNILKRVREKCFGRSDY